MEIEQFECSGVKEKSHLSGAVAIFFFLNWWRKQAFSLSIPYISELSFVGSGQDGGNSLLYSLMAWDEQECPSNPGRMVPSPWDVIVIGLLSPGKEMARREGKQVIRGLEAAEASLLKFKSSVLHDLVKEMFFSPFFKGLVLSTGRVISWSWEDQALIVSNAKGEAVEMGTQGSRLEN